MEKGSSRKINYSDGGFTLLEVVLSIGILAVVSFPLLRYFSESLRYSEMVEKRQQATFLAQEITEGILEVNRLVSKVENSEGLIINEDGESVTGSISGYTVPYLWEELGYSQDINSVYVPGASAPGVRRFLSSGSGATVFKKTVEREYDYDVYVTITAPDDETMEKVKELSDYVQDFSNYGINSDKDVVCADGGETAQAIFEFMGKNYLYVQGIADPAQRVVSRKTADKIREQMHREININLSLAGSTEPGSAAKEYRVEISYVYKCPGIEGGEDVISEWKTGNLVDTTVKELRNIYILYDWCEGGDTVFLKDNGSVAEMIATETDSGKLGLNIIYQERATEKDQPESDKFPTAAYTLIVDRDSYLGILSVYSNVGQPLKTGGQAGVLEGTQKFPLNTFDEETFVDSFIGAGKPSLVYTVCTEVYPKGSDPSAEDPLAVVNTTKGE